MSGGWKVSECVSESVSESVCGISRLLPRQKRELVLALMPPKSTPPTKDAFREQPLTKTTIDDILAFLQAQKRSREGGGERGGVDRHAPYGQEPSHPPEQKTKK